MLWYVLLELKESRRREEITECHMNAGITEFCFCWLLRMLYNFALFKSVNGLETESFTVIIHNKATGYNETSI